MKNILLLSIAVVFVLIFNTSKSQACSTFCIHDSVNLVFGRNYDFPSGLGLVYVNKRDLVKTAFVQLPEKQLVWTSKYGSITFNQIGKEFPHGGMNEKGLVIELMWLAETKYPESDDRFCLQDLQWIQFQLDNYSTVAEVIASDSFLRISNRSSSKIHFLVCDKGGNVAVIEYLNGKMVCHSGADVPVYALANDTYENSLAYLKGFSGFGGTTPMSFTSGSMARFVKAASMLKDYHNQNVIDYSFAVLDSIQQKNFTRWSIVYDIKNRSVYYKTLTNNTIRTYNFSDFNFSCALPSEYVDIEENMTAGKLIFHPYSAQANSNLVNEVFSSVQFLQSVPEVVRKGLAAYPESVTCRN
jgi:choloylglycine hydrolase